MKEMHIRCTAPDSVEKTIKDALGSDPWLAIIIDGARYRGYTIDHVPRKPGRPPLAPLNLGQLHSSTLGIIQDRAEALATNGSIIEEGLDGIYEAAAEKRAKKEKE